MAEKVRQSHYSIACPLELEVRIAVSHMMWVMVTELASSGRTLVFLNCLSPYPNVFEDSIFSAEKILYVLNTRIKDLFGFLWYGRKRALHPEGYFDIVKNVYKHRPLGKD